MNSKLIKNKDYYFDKDGLMVFTKEYLLERGFCCGNGCRHCPYNYVNVPEPGQSFLLKEKNGDKDGDEA